VGKDRPGAGAEGGVQPVEPAALTLPSVKPPPDRLYGRARGHKLRPRQERLLQLTLPRLALAPADLAPADLAPADLTSPGQGLAPDWLPSGPLWLEVGFGGGEHALAQVRAHPEATLIACEVFENGICSLLSALVPEGAAPEGAAPEGAAPEGIVPEGGVPERGAPGGAEAEAPLPPNLRLWTDDARVLLRTLPDACLDRLFLLFPDPWPKARHAKRRFVHPATLPLLARVLKPGAEWRVASDDPTYQAWVRDVMAAQTLFAVSEPATRRPDGWPPTRYEAKALRAGRQPLYWVFRRLGG
jgi:tRNA (guanine-N7-)-methyltransferase